MISPNTSSDVNTILASKKMPFISISLTLANDIITLATYKTVHCTWSNCVRLRKR